MWRMAREEMLLDDAEQVAYRHGIFLVTRMSGASFWIFWNAKICLMGKASYPA